MKKLSFLLAVLMGSMAAFSQVQLDKPLQLTGTGTDGKIEGIKSVSASQDAVSAEVIQKNTLTYVQATGSANTYAAAYLPAITAYTAGQMLSFKAGVANTGASTLNVNGLGAKEIKKNGSADLAANDIKSGQVVTVIYDGTQFQMISQIGNASGGGNSGGGDPTLIYTTNGF